MEEIQFLPVDSDYLQRTGLPFNSPAVVDPKSKAYFMLLGIWLYAGGSSLSHFCDANYYATW